MRTMTSQTIEITMPDGVAEAYLSAPDGGRHPAVLCYVDGIGLRPRIEEMADRIAGWGYVVLAPNVFYRLGRAADLRPTADLSVPANREAFFASAGSRIAGHTTQQATADLDAYLDLLLSRPEVAPGAVGVTGYCMGGRLSLLAAAARPDVVAAAGAFHAGGLVTDAADGPHRRIGTARAEVFAAHAAHDPSNPPEAIAAFEQAMSDAGLTYTSEVFAGAPHGFTMSDTSAYDEQAAERHFRELRSLLDRTLRG